MTTKPKVLNIVGPTAAGKTSLSIVLAKAFSGEVISADSRQVYRGLDLLSGKVTEEEMEDVPHHLLDVADPKNIYTADDFTRDAITALESILKRQKLPIIAGGTFFYTDMLLGRISTPQVPPNPTYRATLETKTTEDLYALVQQKDPRRAQMLDPDNKPRLIRALEIIDVLGVVPESKPQEKYDVCTLGISITKEQLHENILKRIHIRLDEGMVAEVEALLAAGVTHERLDAFGLECRYISKYLQDSMTLEEMIEELNIKTRQFAKRQLTWLKRDETIQWIDPKDTDRVKKIVKEWLE